MKYKKGIKLYVNLDGRWLSLKQFGKELNNYLFDEKDKKIS